MDNPYIPRKRNKCDTKNKRAKKWGTAHKLSLAVVVNPGQCTIKTEPEPEKLAALGKYPEPSWDVRAWSGEMLLDGWIGL